MRLREGAHIGQDMSLRTFPGEAMGSDNEPSKLETRIIISPVRHPRVMYWELLVE